MLSRDGKSGLDEELYSRQLYVLGLDGMRALEESDILISGLGGLGVEVAKNVILAGVKSVTLHDDKVCSWIDLSNQFFLSEQDLGHNRALASINKLKELNQYVQIETFTDPLTEELLSNFSVVVLTDASYNEQLRISELTHSLGIKLIIGEVKGLCYKIFCDFGESFMVVDLDGEAQSMHLIAGITQAKEGVVALIDDEKHGFEDGDYVTFSDIQGMTELNSCSPIQVKILSPDAFVIGDTSNFSPYIDGGVVQKVKMPIVLNFEPFKKALNSLHIQEVNGTPEDQSLQLHIAFMAYHIFKEERFRQPRPWNNRDASDFLEKCKTFINKLEMKISIDPIFLTNFAKTCSGYFAPICAIAGGIISQEVIKACSAKFAPIRQWQFFSSLDCLPDVEISEYLINKPDSRYTGQLLIFGEGIQNQIESLKYLVVGIGGIGCEILKNFAMMGVGSDSKGEVIISDADIIEKSNLNRQFLFRPNDIQKHKSIIAAAAIKNMNPKININPYLNKVEAKSEGIYTSNFFNKLDGVMSAVDHFESRAYIDHQCVYYRKPLIECGSSGTKGSTQVIVPFITESYSSVKDPPDKILPICTLKSFPNNIEHTIIWARDIFNEAFCDSLQIAASYLKDVLTYKESFKKSIELEIEILASIKQKLVDELPTTFLDCVVWARLQWQELFHNQIRHLLSCFPSDQIATNGQLFWSGPKRCPIPLEFSSSDQLHLDFIVAAANLKAKTYGIPENLDRSLIAEMTNKINVPEFAFRTLRISDNENDYISNFRAAVSNKLNFLNVVNSLPSNTEVHLFPLVFDKDNDTNLHIDFIRSAANLRARNYKIPPADRLQVKLISGKITPAIVSTSSVIAGFACLEVIKLLQHFQDISRYKNCFLNLALPFLGISEPRPAPEMKFYEYNWNLWDRFDIEGEQTLTEFLNYFRTKWKLEVTMATYGFCILYSNFSDRSLIQQRKDLYMSQLCALVSKKEIEAHQTALVIEICCTTLDGRDVDVPYVNYILPGRQAGIDNSASSNNLDIKIF